MSVDNEHLLYPRAKKRIVDRVNNRLREFRSTEFSGAFSPAAARNLADVVEMMISDLHPYRRDLDQGREYDETDPRVTGIDTESTP